MSFEIWTRFQKNLTVNCLYKSNMVFKRGTMCPSPVQKSLAWIGLNRHKFAARLVNYLGQTIRELTQSKQNHLPKKK